MRETLTASAAAGAVLCRIVGALGAVHAVAATKLGRRAHGRAGVCCVVGLEMPGPPENISAAYGNTKNYHSTELI
jgi:hypothetical protein